MSGLSVAMRDGMAEITLNDGKVNALSQVMIEYLLAALDQVPDIAWPRRPSCCCWPITAWALKVPLPRA